jgi:HD-GYP domain-containing protein (c-di-GMP phosphodiesterase class II)
MIHDRWYKRKRTIEGAMEEVKRCAATQFDPAVVAAFLRMLKKVDMEKLMESVEDVVGEIEDAYPADTDEEFALASEHKE